MLKELLSEVVEYGGVGRSLEYAGEQNAILGVC